MEQHHFSTKTVERPEYDVELNGPRDDGYQPPILVVPHSGLEYPSSQSIPLEPSGTSREERVAVASDVQKFANPAPLGLCAFALTSFISNSTNVYVTNVTASGITIALPLAYGGIIQFFAGIWEMMVGNTFGATSFCSYGGYWITFGIMSLLQSQSPDTTTDTCDASILMGVFLMAWCIFTTLMLLCTLKSSLAMFLLFFFLDMNYLLLGIAHLECHSGGEILTSVQRAGGICGLLAALTAWYNAFAGVFDSGNGFFNVPLGHFPWSPAAHAHRKVKSV